MISRHNLFRRVTFRIYYFFIYCLRRVKLIQAMREKKTALFNWNGNKLNFTVLRVDTCILVGYKLFGHLIGWFGPVFHNWSVCFDVIPSHFQADVTEQMLTQSDNPRQRTSVSSAQMENTYDHTFARLKVFVRSPSAQRTYVQTFVRSK